MSLITKYGSFWGYIPQTNGRVWWVAPSDSYVIEGRTYSASNDQDGLSPERALRTLAQAISNSTAGVNDVIVLLPGAHSWTASANVSKAGLTIMGIPGGRGHRMRQRTSITTTAADEIMNVTAANVEIAYLHVIAVTAQAGIDYSNAADQLYVHDCSFDLFSQVESTSTVGLKSVATAGGCDRLLVENCYFESLGGTGAHIILDSVNRGEVANTTFRHTGSTALAEAVQCTTGAVDIMLDNCRFVFGTGAIMTDAIDWTGNTLDASLSIRNCWFNQSTQVNASADNDVNVDLTSSIALIAAGGTIQYPTVINAG